MATLADLEQRSYWLQVDQARTVVRRAERRVAGLLHSGELENPDLLRYLNRLSSLCFVLELVENKAAGQDLMSFAKDLVTLMVAESYEDEVRT